jgi:hypothetical protein
MKAPSLEALRAGTGSDYHRTANYFRGYNSLRRILKVESLLYSKNAHPEGWAFPIPCSTRVMFDGRISFDGIATVKTL